MTLKILNNNSPGNANEWGGDDHDRLATAINLGEAYTYLIIKSGATYYVKNSVGEISTSGGKIWDSFKRYSSTRTLK